MSKIGKILLLVAEVVAIAAVSFYAPQISAFLGTSLFVATAIGSVVITLAFTALSALLFKSPSPSMDQARVNTRIEAPPRWICAGRVLQGGGVLFADFDSNGNFWYLIVHSDSILTSKLNYYFDTILVSFDGSGTGQGNVITNDFCLDSKGNPYSGSGSGRVPYFYVWTRTYTETNPVPPPVNELQAAFPEWTTSDHLLVGTTYSVIKCSAIKAVDRNKIFKYRGPIGLGEPSVTIEATWSNMYDPRDSSQTLGNRTTYKPTRNNALVWAWWRTHPFGRNKPESSINWDQIAIQANICDETVTGIQSTQPRYECGTAIVDSKDRGTAEQEILMGCDGQIVFDDDGKTWCRVGAYYEPTVILSRNRDIIAMESVEAQNGESQTQGVVVRYIDPDSDYAIQASAPWYNPNYYDAGQGNTFLTVDALTCQNHNQAMRLAKSIGVRSQPLQKLAPTTGLRGLKTMQERFVNIVYDNEFAGDYEIAAPVEVDESGAFCSLGLTPTSPTQFDLLSGEEKVKPVTSATDSTSTLLLPTGVTLSYNNNRIEGYFVEPVRTDVTYQFQYIPSSMLSSGTWADMTVDMTTNFTYSGTIDPTQSYLVRYRSTTSGGNVTAWYDPPVNVGSMGDGGTAYKFISQTVISPLTSNDTSITIQAFSGTLDRVINNQKMMNLPAGSVTGLNPGIVYAVFRSIANDQNLPILNENGTVETNENGTPILNEQSSGGTYFATPTPALNDFASNNNLFIGYQSTSSGGGTSYPPSAPVPAGYGGSGNAYQQNGVSE